MLCMFINVRHALLPCYCTITAAALPTSNRLKIMTSVRLFNNWNIITFSNKNTTSEEFEEIHQVVLDDISDNMALLVQYGMCGATNTTNPTTLGYYVVNYTSEAYKLQEETK